jgi:hypothetical protein
MLLLALVLPAALVAGLGLAARVERWDALDPPDEVAHGCLQRLLQPGGDAMRGDRRLRLLLEPLRQGQRGAAVTRLERGGDCVARLCELAGECGGEAGRRLGDMPRCPAPAASEDEQARDCGGCPAASHSHRPRQLA